MNTHLKSMERGLWTVLFMVFVMILLGGMTRLTGSGLSIVEWKPITGILPPMNTQDWTILFELYKTSPEYLKINNDMTLEGFKNIFWLEYIHRLWGRMMGLVMLWPLVACMRSSALRKRYLDKLLFIFILGASQGVLGWLMVKSGLVSDPHVSHIRLATHFIMGVITFATILWTALNAKIDQGYFEKDIVNRDFILVIATLVLATLFYGALVAGLKAGLIYNSFPLMNGRWIPLEFFHPSFNATYFINDPGIVQFTHRCLALMTFVATLILVGQIKKFSHGLRPFVVGLFVVVLMQASLGVMTVLTHVNITIALLHQAIALILTGIVTSLLALSEQER